MDESPIARGDGTRFAQGEERFRLLIDAIEDYAIYMLSLDGRVMSWNHGAQRNKGYTSEEIIGQHFSRFFLPEDRTADLPGRILREAAETGRFAGEGWRVRKDGSRFWALVVVSVLRDDQGRAIGYAKVTRDLSERRRQEEALRESQKAFERERNRLRVTIYSIADGVIATDELGCINLMNPVAESITGWNFADAQGKRVEEIFRLVNSETGLQIENPVRQCLERNKPVFLQEGVSLVSRDGGKRDLQDSVAPIRTESGDVLGTILVFQDVTRIRTIQREVAFQATHDSLTLLPNRKHSSMPKLLESIKPCAFLT
jgi:PAS domain S-box-containing protein